MELILNLNTVLLNNFGKRFILSKLSYYADKHYSLQNGMLEADNANSVIVILAKKHYDISFESYPSITKAELLKLIKLKQGGDSVKSNYHIVPNHNIDGFDVEVTTINAKIARELEGAIMIVPETVVLLSSLANPSTVLTPSGELYLASNKSAYKHLLINSVDSFCYSLGVNTGTNKVTINLEEFPNYITNTFFEAPLKTLLGNSFLQTNFIKKQLFRMHWLYGVPVITSFMLVAGFIGFDKYQEHSLNSNIQDKRAQVETLISLKRNIDDRYRVIELFNEEIAARKLSFLVWNNVLIAIEHDTKLTSVTMKNGKVEIRGSAINANSVLKAISAESGTKSVAFKGSVRKSRGREYFVITFTIGEDVESK